MPIPGVKDCHALATTDYMDLLWTTLAEFPGISLMKKTVIKRDEWLTI